MQGGGRVGDLDLVTEAFQFRRQVPDPDPDVLHARAAGAQPFGRAGLALDGLDQLQRGAAELRERDARARRLGHRLAVELNPAGRLAHVAYQPVVEAEKRSPRCPEPVDALDDEPYVGERENIDRPHGSSASWPPAGLTKNVKIR